MLIQEKFRELEGHISQIYEKEIQNKTDYRLPFFTMENSNRSVEEHLGINGVGTMTAWTGSVDYEDFTKGFQKNYRHAKLNKGIQIERELLDFGNFSEIKRRVKKLVTDSVYPTMQIDGAKPFNNAFTDTNTADGVALCSASHPLSPEDSDTQNNAGTYELTPSNIDTVRQAMINFENDKGIVLNVVPDTIIVGPKLWKTAKEIVGSKQEPYTAENQINVFSNGELQMLYNPYIKGNAWFLADAMKMKDNLYWYTARAPKPEYTSDFETEVGKYKVVGLWSFGFDTWEWVYGNNLD